MPCVQDLKRMMKDKPLGPDPTWTTSLITTGDYMAGYLQPGKIIHSKQACHVAIKYKAVILGHAERNHDSQDLRQVPKCPKSECYGSTSRCYCNFVERRCGTGRQAGMKYL